MFSNFLLQLRHKPLFALSKSRYNMSNLVHMLNVITDAYLYLKTSTAGF